MALLAPQAVSIVGTTPTYSTVNATDTVKLTSNNLYLHVKNANAGAVTVTVVVPGTKFGQANPDVVVTIAPGAEKFIGSFAGEMVDPTTQLISVTFSPTATVTSALLAF